MIIGLIVVVVVVVGFVVGFVGLMSTIDLAVALDLFRR